MTHQIEANLSTDLLQLLLDPGVGESRFSVVLRLLFNEAMKLERTAVLRAQPYERAEERRGYANGYKPRTLTTKRGQLELEVPQVRRGVDFYPSALDRGERALKLAIAEMNVQDTSTRKGTQVLEQLCGLEISSTQVSRCAELLDAELAQWRHRPLGEILYPVLDARYEKVRQAGSVVSCAVLSAIGIDAQGRRSVRGERVTQRSRDPLARVPQ